MNQYKHNTPRVSGNGKIDKPLNNSKCSESDSKMSGLLFANMFIAF